MFRCTIPEGVEVRLSADLIKPLVLGKNIVDVETFETSRYADIHPDNFKDFKNILSSPNSITIIDVTTKGKFMYWSFSNDWYLLCTFGMSGQWSPTKGKHPCFAVKYYEASEGVNKLVYFNDPRHFGTIKFVKSQDQLKAKLNTLGWDPLKHGLNVQNINWVKNKINNSKKPISQLLMDQGIFAGVGNYIKAESLYEAKISPWRSGNSLSVDEINSLCQAIVNVMETSYKYQGATILTYKTAFGEEGRYSSCFKVYGKTVDPLGNIVKTETTPDKRTTHWVPAIQK